MLNPEKIKRAVWAAEEVDLSSASPQEIVEHGTKEPSTVIGRNIGDLEQIFCVAAKVSSLKFDRATIRNYVRHEKRHILAAEELGAGIVGVGVTFHNYVPHEKIDFLPFIRFETVGLSPLETAAIAAAPYDPSQTDLYHIRDLGFSGVQEVGILAVESNLTGDFPRIPIPLSFDPTVRL